MKNITWTSKKIKIKELKEYSNNPRRINKDDFQKLVKFIKQDGYHQRLLVNTNNIIIGGHQRKKALLESGFNESDEIEVLVPDRELSDDELDRLNIRDNLPFGDWDWDILSNRFDPETLIDFGMDTDWMKDFAEGIKSDEEKDAEQGSEKSVCECTCCKH